MESIHIVVVVVLNMESYLIAIIIDMEMRRKRRLEESSNQMSMLPPRMSLGNLFTGESQDSDTTGSKVLINP